MTIGGIPIGSIPIGGITIPDLADIIAKNVTDSINMMTKVFKIIECFIREAILLELSRS